MAIEKTDIDAFLVLAKKHPVLDVRSPGEFNHAHIPGAHNLPLFSDEERKIVGTAYKQESREQAIKIGLEYFGLKMRGIVEEAEKLTTNGWQLAANKNIPSQHASGNAKTVLVHCWRGGMRSAAIAWLLNLYGFTVFTLSGGYKKFRNYVLETFKRPFPFYLLAGYTGTGKTDILCELASQGEAVIDLEALAYHKGSAFGGIGKPAQPSQEMFENRLALELHAYCPGTVFSPTTLAANCIWLEDESQRVGTLTIPSEIWKRMRSSDIYFLNIPVEARLDHISSEYGDLNKEQLCEAIRRIQKRLGGLETKTAIRHLSQDNTKECFRILLTYYDKYYRKGLLSRVNGNECIVHIEGERVNEKENAQRIFVAMRNQNRDAGTKSTMHVY